jgi:hypothetical protein
MEHLGNIQGTFKELAGNIQFELRWTLVSPHPNCKKHLKKVIRLTQNTTCPHEYLRQGLRRPNNVSQHSENIQGTFREHSRNLQGTFLEFPSGTHVRRYTSGSPYIPLTFHIFPVQ